MTTLLAQFLSEGRDLLDDAVRGLLEMERGEGSGEVVNTVFRSIHTLKGTSGLFEIAPLTAIVHAGEDLLETVRSGRLAIDARMVDLLLSSLDVTRTWLDELEQAERLPEDADIVAAAHVGVLRSMLSGVLARSETASGDDGAATQAGAPGWVAELDREERLAAEETARRIDRDLVAVRYRPDPGCFFHGEDPLQLVRQVPELVALRIGQSAPWPGADSFDPFDCLLDFSLLSIAPVEDLRHLFRYSETTTITAYAAPGRPGADWPVVSEVLAAQSDLLGLPCDTETTGGRASSAAEILRRACRHCGRAPPDEGALQEAVERTVDGDARALQAFMQVRNADPDAQDAGSLAVVPDLAPEPKVAAHATLKVDAARIDLLMNLIGELIVAKNSLSYIGRKAEAGATARELARDIKDQQAVVNRLAEDMQSAIMAIRMLPISHVFQRFTRLVRDIGRKLGKQVVLEVSGEETEADKNMIEALADPLMHMVRNSLDHGLEAASERHAAGKTAHGTISLAAEQLNESIMVTIRDDGRGIDLDRVREKAVRRGMLTADAAAALPDPEALRLVFAPGFSTSDAVSDLSGRGVGMDVVRSSVERLGGTVALESQLGLGTTVRITLPLTMTVTRIMTVECGRHLFGIPMNTVVESVRLPASRVRRILDKEVFVLRDRIVPLVRLAGRLELPHEEVETGAAGVDLPVLVLRSNDVTIGLVIDAFRERMDAIVRPLDGILAGLAHFSGTTLLGDGRVLLVLNVMELT